MTYSGTWHGTSLAPAASLTFHAVLGSDVSVDSAEVFLSGALLMLVVYCLSHAMRERSPEITNDSVLMLVRVCDKT